METRIKICGNCKKEFTVPKSRKYNATKYCCEKCRKEAYAEAHNKAQQEYKKRWREYYNHHEIHNSQFGNTQLNRRIDGNWEKEHQAILQELNRLHLRRKKDHEY